MRFLYLKTPLLLFFSTLLLFFWISFSHSVHASNLLESSNTRLLKRLHRWNTMCEQREARKTKRLQTRSIFRETNPNSAIDKTCNTIRTRLVETSRSTLHIPTSESEQNIINSLKPETPTPIIQPKEKNLKLNQLFTPTLPLPSLEVQSRFLVLEDAGPVIGTIKLNPLDEPIDIREVRITMTQPLESVTAIEVGDEFGYYLGSATPNRSLSPDGRVFQLSLSPDKAYFIKQDDEVIIAFRPRLKKPYWGGISNESEKISSIAISATGRWTSRENLVHTSGSDFREHTTSLTTIDTIKRVGSDIGTITVGTDVTIGTFRFETRPVTDANAEPRLLSIQFSLNASSSIAITNAFLRDPIGNVSSPCTITSSQILCTSIPADLGTIEAPRELTLTANVTQLNSVAQPFLSIDINRPGGPGSPGDIEWTDGVSIFNWVPFGQPVARGTSWK